MKSVVLTASLLGMCCFGFEPCLKRKAHKVEHIEDKASVPSVKYANVKDLPTSLDWRWYNGQRYTTWTRNQHAPNYCGSCWAQASVSAMNDRIMISTNNAFPEWDLAPQVLLDCDMTDDGCHGGDPSTAYAYILNNGITSETYDNNTTTHTHTCLCVRFFVFVCVCGVVWTLLNAYSILLILYVCWLQTGARHMRQLVTIQGRRATTLHDARTAHLVRKDARRSTRTKFGT